MILNKITNIYWLSKPIKTSYHLVPSCFVIFKKICKNAKIFRKIRNTYHATLNYVAVIKEIKNKNFERDYFLHKMKYEITVRSKKPVTPSWTFNKNRKYAGSYKF